MITKIKKYIAIFSILSVLSMILLTGCSNKLAFKGLTQTTLKNSIDPQKMIILDMSTLDTLDSLGAGRKIVGMSKSNLPSYLSIYKNPQYKDVGKYNQPNVERIKELQPDLIIIGNMQADLYTPLSEIAPILLLDIDPQKYTESVENNIMLLAQLTQKQTLAKQYLKVLSNHIQAINLQTKELALNAIVAQYENGLLRYDENSAYAALIHDTLGIKRITSVPSESEAEVVTDNKEKTATEPVKINSQFIKQHQANIIFIIDVDKAKGKPAIGANHPSYKLLKDAGIKIVYLPPERWVFSPWGIDSLSQQINEISSLLPKK